MSERVPTRRPARPLAAAAAALSLLVAGGCAGPSRPPNLVLINTDDATVEDLEHLPAIQRELVSAGVTFDAAFVSSPLCCPSRASLLTGRYAHNHGVLDVSPPRGGFPAFRDRGEGAELATWLHQAGYRTALFGKYFNAYPRRRVTHVAPGWDEWFALHSMFGKPLYNGYTLTENGEPVRYGTEASDYQTDVLAAHVLAVLERFEADDESPFFLYVAPSAPHLPAVPAPRHRRRFRGAQAPRTPAFDEEAIDDKPPWIRSLPRLDAEATTAVDRLYRDRLRTLLAVDELVAKVLDTLRRQGEIDRTWILFTSDNGYLQGSHRVAAGKKLPYRESIAVPLVVRGPGVPSGSRRDELVLNIDLAPTLAELAGIPVPADADGRSFSPLLRGESPPWRHDFLVEGFNLTDEPGAPPPYAGVRSADALYVEYEGGERELYDLAADPWELDNLLPGAPADAVEPLQRRLAELRDCAGAACRRDAGR